MEAFKTQIWEVLPFIVMVIMEGCTIGLTIFAKTVFTNGMNPFLFIVYSNSLASLILFPLSFLSHLFNKERSLQQKQKQQQQQQTLTFSLFLRLLFLGFTGITMTQSFSFLGLSYSSPILVCAMGHLIPSFNFLLSLFLRKNESLKLRSYGILFQVMGSVVCMMGAVLVELFKGPLISPSSHKLQFWQHFFVFSSKPEFWILGGVLLAASSFSLALSNFIQKETLKQYPEPMKVIFSYTLIGTILSAMVSFTILERDLDAWKLKHKMELILIVLTALFGGVIRPSVQVWFPRLKGPFYVQIFKPFGIAYATTFGVVVFPNSLHYGSVIGTAIIGMGYYCVMWGQIKREEDKRGCDEISDSLDNNVPLLQPKMQMDV